MTEVKSLQEERSAFFFHVKTILEDQARREEIDVDPQAVAVLSELLWLKSGELARDLEAFARHDKDRRTVMVKDVLLCSRRSPRLHAELKAKASEIEQQRNDKRRRQGNAPIRKKNQM